MSTRRPCLFVQVRSPGALQFPDGAFDLGAGVQQVGARLLARPALELVTPHLRPGAIVVCDNTEQYRSAYADYFAFLAEPANGFRTMTLPFDGGLELSVRCPS